MTELVPSFNFELINQEDYMWRMKGGTMIPLQNLKTSHAVNILKMIWNNTVTKQFRFPNAKLYYFNDFYTDQYMKVSVYFIACELAARSDLSENDIHVIRVIMEYMNKKQAITFQPIDIR